MELAGASGPARSADGPGWMLAERAGGKVILIRRLEDFPAELRGGALTIGNFDGVHRGHRLLVDRLRAAAQRCCGPAVVFTFDPHPACLLRPAEAPPPLTWIDRKAALLGELGVDVVLACHTTEALLELHWRDFFGQVIRDAIGAAAVVEGSNFRFGRRREGDIHGLARSCQEAGIAFEAVDTLTSGGAVVSSSGIRELIRLGKVDEAARLLTRPYCLRGLVIHGAGRGKGLGFPTANLGGIETLVPAHGIYAGRARPGDAAVSCPAAVHIGPSPTFGDGVSRVEVHLLDFGDDLYGQVVEVEFFQRLREIRQFESSDELLEQMRSDIAAVRACLPPG